MADAVDAAAVAAAAVAEVAAEAATTRLYCMSFWVSIALVLIVYPWRVHSILLALGIAGAASFAERFLGTGVDQGEDNDG